MKVLLPGILAILLCVGLSGCNYISDLFLSDDDRLLGSWNTYDLLIENIGEVPAVFTFFTNGSLKIHLQFGGGFDVSSEGTWDMKDGVFSMEIEDVLSMTSYRYRFTEDNTVLTLTEIDTTDSMVLTKQ